MGNTNDYNPDKILTFLADLALGGRLVSGRAEK